MKIPVVFALVLLSPAAAAVSAQAPSPAPMPVTLVAGPSPSKGGRVEVIRRAQRTPANIVVVDKNATAEDLAAALTMLNALRQQFGDSLPSDIRARPDVVRPGPTWQKSRYRSWLVEQLVRLRSARAAELADFGMVRSAQVLLPAVNGAINGDRGKK